MSTTKKMALCALLATTVSSFAYADVSLQLRSGAIADIHSLSRHTGVKENGSSVANAWYVQYNTSNKNKVDPKYGSAYERSGNTGFLTLDPSNEKTGQCVTFVKTLTSNYTTTGNWIRGNSVTSSTPKGTIIAKFTGANNKYDGNNGGHVAIIQIVYANGTALVYDQNYRFDGKLALRKYSANELSKHSIVMRP